jgi:hypothetical protein
MPAQLSDPPSELELRPGESSRFRVGGGGAVGYGWTWTIDGDAEAIAVDIEPASPPPAPGEFRAGSVDHIVVVRGLQVGTARLHLVLARPVAPSRGPLADFTVAVKVVPAAAP